jgi:hypothetical protein
LEEVKEKRKTEKEKIKKNKKNKKNDVKQTKGIEVMFPKMAIASVVFLFYLVATMIAIWISSCPSPHILTHIVHRIRGVPCQFLVCQRCICSADSDITWTSILNLFYRKVK